MITSVIFTFQMLLTHNETQNLNAFIQQKCILQLMFGKTQDENHIKIEKSMKDFNQGVYPKRMIQ